MKEKIYKCVYKYCKQESGKILPGSEIKVGNRNMHSDCAEESETVTRIRDYYYENVSNTVVMKTLVGVINNIVYKKGIEAKYLLFAIKFTVENRIPLKSPYGLHYIIDNFRIKEAWKKKRDAVITKKTLEAASEASIDFEPPQSTFVYKADYINTFGKIFK